MKQTFKLLVVLAVLLASFGVLVLAEEGSSASGGSGSGNSGAYYDDSTGLDDSQVLSNSNQPDLTESEIEKLEMNYPSSEVTEEQGKNLEIDFQDETAMYSRKMALLKVHVYSLFSAKEPVPTAAAIMPVPSNTGEGIPKALVFLVRIKSNPEGFTTKNITQVRRTNQFGNTWFLIKGVQEPNEQVYVIVKHPRFVSKDEGTSIKPGEVSYLNIGLKPKQNVQEDKKEGYRAVYYECYDGTSDTVKAEACIPASSWKTKVVKVCESRCKTTTTDASGQPLSTDSATKCGVNSFQLQDACAYEKPYTEKPRPVPQFEWNESVTKQLVYKLIERVANLEQQVNSLEQRISQLEKLLNVGYYPEPKSVPPTEAGNQEPVSIKPIPTVTVTTVRPEYVETTAGSIEPTSNTSTVEVQEGIPYIINKQDRSIKKEIQVSDVRSYVEEKMGKECGLDCVSKAKDYQIKVGIDNTGKETYTVTAEIPNKTFLINWFVPTKTETYNVPFEEIEKRKAIKSAQPSLVEDLEKDSTLSSYIKETK